MFSWRGLEAWKLEFSGLKGQFDVKKVNFRGLIAKTGHYRPILATSNPIMAHLREYIMRIVL